MQVTNYLLTGMILQVGGLVFQPNLKNIIFPVGSHEYLQSSNIYIYTVYTGFQDFSVSRIDTLKLCVL